MGIDLPLYPGWPRSSRNKKKELWKEPTQKSSGLCCTPYLSAKETNNHVCLLDYIDDLFSFFGFKSCSPVARHRQHPPPRTFFPLKIAQQARNKDYIISYSHHFQVSSTQRETSIICITNYRYWLPVRRPYPESSLSISIGPLKKLGPLLKWAWRAEYLSAL